MKRMMAVVLAVVMCVACMVGCDEEKETEKKDWDALVEKALQDLPEMTEVAQAMLYEAGQYEEQVADMMAELIVACEEYEGEAACEKLNDVCRDNADMLSALTSRCIEILDEYGADVPTSRFSAAVAEAAAEMSSWQMEYRNAESDDDYEDLMDEAEDWVNALSEALYEQTLV